MLARPATPPAALALSRTPCCRKKWSEQRFPCVKKWLSPGFTYELPSPRAMLKDAKEPVYAPTPLVYPVRRREPELVGPAAKTPRETKILSDIDHGFGLQGSAALFYRGRNDGIDPAVVIRRALGEALVQYYPLAGRLRETEGQRLVVDCTGEGVLFVEADADVRLSDLQEAGLRLPLPCWGQLLFDVEGSRGMLNTPLLLIQVTRLSCGGFVLAIRFNHTMLDGKGIVQFINAICELPRGLPYVTVTPVWSRELLQARSPPSPSFIYRQFKELPPALPAGDMVARSFTFGASDIVAIKKSLRDKATTFEILAALLWCAHTAAVEVPPSEDAPLVFVASFRGAAKTRLPKGYYGNTVGLTAVQVDAKALLGGSLGDAVALMRKQKAALTAEHVRSLVDEMVLLGRRWVMPANMFMLSDTTSLGYYRLDMGWGEPVFAGPADPSLGASFLIAVKDRDGEDAVSVPVMLPRLAMVRLAAEVDRLLAA